MDSSISSDEKEVVSELLPLIKVYKDGTVERLLGSPYVPPSLNDPETGVSSKDVIISQNPNISARLYLPKLTHDDDEQHHQQQQKLPILVYYHGGGFCIESAFSFLGHRYLNILVSQAKVIAVSVEYRLAPEHPLPIAYEDSWTALQWVISHSLKHSPIHNDLWLINDGDFDKIFIGGDSAGANIAHNIAMKANSIDNFKIFLHGVFLVHPYFWGSDPIGDEPDTDREETLEYRVWKFAYPTAKGGIDDPAINPDQGGSRLSGIGCGKLLVCVAGKDSLRNRGLKYGDDVRKSGWDGEVEVFEVEDEDHAFHIFYPDSENAKKMFKCLASFLSSRLNFPALCVC